MVAVETPWPTCFAMHDPSPIAVGDFSVTIVPGGVGAVCWQGVEVLRGVTCLVRDQNWGTFAAENFVESRFSDFSHATVRQLFNVNNGAAAVEVSTHFDASGQLDLTAKITAQADMMTNRAGLVILHPIATTAGTALTILHPDGQETRTAFPRLIAPGQPAANMAGLSHAIGNVQIDIGFEGDVFEMEDQRNWSDASFKTYCRPLALPFPYALAAGETITQKLRLKLREAGPAEAATGVETAQGTVVGALPQMLLAVEEGWLPAEHDWPQIKALGAQGLLLRLNAEAADQEIWNSTANLAAELGAFVDLELIVSTEGMARQISAIAEWCKGSTHISASVPAHVMVLPEHWLKSYQPGQGPSMRSLEAAIQQAALAFPGSAIGAGMLTNFTELNRYPAAGGDYITHGNTAIVHAADDLSVWQTLEALPQIFASGQAIAGARGYRLGLVAIAMRSNPYGAALAENPKRQMKALAGEDPRQTKVFAAAYALGAAFEAAFGGVAAMALAAPIGRFGVMDQQGQSLYPLYHAVRALGRLSGQQVRRIQGLAAGLIGISTDDGSVVVANCSPSPAVFESAGSLSARILADDPLPFDWLDTGAAKTGRHFVLAPGACLFAQEE
jgi:D-apionolactonase